MNLSDNTISPSELEYIVLELVDAVHEQARIIAARKGKDGAANTCRFCEQPLNGHRKTCIFVRMAGIKHRTDAIRTAAGWTKENK